MKGAGFLLVAAAMGMELSWRYAWASFLAAAMLGQVFPFPEAAGSFVLAALITSFHYGRGWRVFLVLCLQLLGFIPALMRIVDVFNTWSPSFLSRAFSAYAAAREQQGVPQEWLIVFLLLFWAVFFWGGGVSQAKRTGDYHNLCARFDLGLGAFTLLFLTKFYLALTGSGDAGDRTGEFMLFSYFIFGLGAIGLARNRSGGAKDFLPGYRGIGVILSFIATVTMFGGGLLFFGLSYLTGAARTGLTLLKAASSPALSLLKKIIHFLLGDDFTVAKVEKPVVKKIAKETMHGPSGLWWEILGKVLYWLVIVLVSLVVAAICLAFLYSFGQWLFSKTEEGRKRLNPWEVLVMWATGFLGFLRSCRGRMVGGIKESSAAIRLYAALLRWGRRSGLPHLLQQTPNEYAARLVSRFPALKGEIDSIVEAFNGEVYGGRECNRVQIAPLSAAFRRMCSPRHWPPRFKTWFQRSV